MVRGRRAVGCVGSGIRKAALGVPTERWRFHNFEQRRKTYGQPSAKIQGRSNNIRSTRSRQTSGMARSRDLFTIWFGSNLMMLTIVTGALATTVFKLSFMSSIGAIALGNFVGAIFMALHAAQGPRLGVPQMVQTRGQFGSIGAVLVVGIVIIMYVGFLASNIVLGGQSLHTIAPGVSQNLFIVLIAWSASSRRFSAMTSSMPMRGSSPGFRASPCCWRFSGSFSSTACRRISWR